MRLTAEVQISPLFFGWCCSFGKKLKLTSPASVAEELHAYAATVCHLYE